MLMGMREKLIELLMDCDCPYPGKAADYLMQNGVTIPRPCIMNEDEVMGAYRMWCAGYTRQQIANMLSVNLSTLVRAFKRYGLTNPRGKGRRATHE